MTEFAGFSKSNVARPSAIDVLSEGTISDVLEEPEGVPPELLVVHQLVGILSIRFASVPEMRFFATTTLVSFPMSIKLLLEVRSMDSTVEDTGIVKVLTSLLDNISKMVPRFGTQPSVVSISSSVLLDHTIVDVVSSLFG